MKPLVPLFVAACVALSAAARADVYMKVEADGSVTLTDEARSGYEHVPEVAPPAAAGAPRAGRGAPSGDDGAARDAASAVPLPFASLVAAAAAEHGLPEALLHAVIRAESNYDPNAVSAKGAIGLMQLMPATALELGVANARDPAANIRGGARYLKRLMEMFGDDLALALAAYNAGPAAVVRSGGPPPYAETRRYVPRVIDHFERLRARLAAATS